MLGVIGIQSGPPGRWVHSGFGPVGGRGRKTKAFTYECADWGRQTSVTAGTIMHASKLPLTMWFWAAFLMSTHSNGISALQLSSQARPPPQPGQTNPSGQRRSKRYSAHAFRGKAALKLKQRLRKPSLRSRHDTHPCSSDTVE